METKALSFLPALVPSHSPMPFTKTQERTTSPARYTVPNIHSQDAPSPIATTGSVVGSEGPTYGIYRDDKIPVGNVLHLDRIEQGQSHEVISL